MRKEKKPECKQARAYRTHARYIARIMAIAASDRMSSVRKGTMKTKINHKIMEGQYEHRYGTYYIP